MNPSMQSYGCHNDEGMSAAPQNRERKLDLLGTSSSRIATLYSTM